ncbi:MAG TPA: tRNA guanosine(34) transglycosylase Tgt, partial [candidate division Zixibacteria bacterium]|nr:tRNA guanosine(34) transglycosylase Tgt [candidate division Zixibacteria bacterium]
MSRKFAFEISARDGRARRGALATAHGTVQTPAFMPVGTAGAVKALTCADLEACGVEMILGNTYHLYLRPGPELIHDLGGLAAFNGWRRPTLTDSGGFQVLSLAEKLKITDEGVTFASIHDGSLHHFTPEKAIDVQMAIGADIIMSFDQCPPADCDVSYATQAVERTTAWAKRGKLHFDGVVGEAPEKDTQSVFGIAQGWLDKELRRRSASEIIEIDFPGYAIGGLAVGETKEQLFEMTDFTAALLPDDKPRYLMGVGYPGDILHAVACGVDMFDCVLPTRNARTGHVFTSEGPLVYRNAEYARDEGPLDPNCDCMVCRRYSRAYLRHLYNQKEITAYILATYHSIYFYQSLMRNIRAAIADGVFETFRR